LCNLDPGQELARPRTSSPGEVAAEQEATDQVAVDVAGEGAEDEEETRREEAMELEWIGSQRRAVRSRSGRPPPLVPWSHSTGHSLAMRLDDDLERFTLRLPEHMRREMVAAGEESRFTQRARRGSDGGQRR